MRPRSLMYDIAGANILSSNGTACLHLCLQLHSFISHDLHVGEELGMGFVSQAHMHTQNASQARLCGQACRTIACVLVL